MSFLYLPGEAANHILTASSFSTSSSEDSNLPWTNLKNPQGWFAGRFDVAAADDFIHADLGSSKAATFCSVHFHNLDDAITVELRRGASGSTLVATMTKYTPAFYATFNSASDQHWRLKFVGTNSSKGYLAKWALGEHQTLTQVQGDGSYNVSHIMEQRRIDPILPPKNLTKFARRRVTLKLLSKSVSERDEVLQMLRDSAWGAEPLVVVPDDNDASVVLYGRLSGEWDYTQDGLIYKHSLTIDEDPFPVIVN